MSVAQSLLREFDEEIADTREMLRRVPEARATWKPHEKSMTLGRLATLLAELPGWAVNVLELDELDIAPGGKLPKFAVLPTTKAVLEMFEENAARARKLLLAAQDAQLGRPWAFKFNGKVISQDPRAHVYRRSVMNHMVHHRAQLGVYLRILGVPLPAIYGPSADEG